MNVLQLSGEITSQTPGALARSCRYIHRQMMVKETVYINVMLLGILRVAMNRFDQVPSLELTYPTNKALLKMIFLFPSGGICFLVPFRVDPVELANCEDVVFGASWGAILATAQAKLRSARRRDSTVRCWESSEFFGANETKKNWGPALKKPGGLKCVTFFMIKRSGWGFFKGALLKGF